MKRFLLWILGVVLGVAFFLAAIMGVSWWLTGTSDLPETGGAAFAGVALEENGYLWQVPLVGAVADKVFYAAPTLTTQRLGEVGDAHPAFTLPDWATDAQLEITDTETGQTVFSGDLAAYAGFYYPAAGTYTVTARVWRLPEGMAAADLAGSRDRVARNPARGLVRVPVPVRAAPGALGDPVVGYDPAGRHGVPGGAGHAGQRYSHRRNGPGHRGVPG